jgi:uncharacterized protein YjbJ (UPF0337 family)
MNRMMIQGERRDIMGASSDKAKGRIKEATGDLTGDKDLKREGQADQAGAKVKDMVNKGVDKVKDAVDRDNK